MNFKNLFKRWGMTSLKIKAPFVEAEYKPKPSETTEWKKKKILQLGYVYGQYTLTEGDGRKAVAQQLKNFWSLVAERAPKEAVPKSLSTVYGLSIVGELATFIKSALIDSGLSEDDQNLCLLGFLLFCQPLARSIQTTELVIKYSHSAPISTKERDQLKNDCVADGLKTKDGAMAFFNKWTRLIEERF